MNNSDEKRLIVQRYKGQGKSGMCYLTPLSPRDLSEISEESFDLPFLNPANITRSNSCRGFLFFVDHTGCSYLCNPTTKHIHSFPPKEPPVKPKYKYKLAGACVGYDSKSDDYKILRIWNRRSLNTCYCARTFELYSIRNNSWKEIPSPAFMCTSPTHVRDLIGDVIHARGKCYWLSLAASRVVSFDFSKESFSYLPLPGKTFRYGFYGLVKFSDEDLIGIADSRRRSYANDPPFVLGSEAGLYIEVWVWREKLQIWDKMFNVSLGGSVTSADTIYGPFLLLHVKADCTRYGKALPVGTRYSYLDRLVVYDWTKKECKDLCICNYDIPVNVLCYDESTLVLPHGKPINGSLCCVESTVGLPYGEAIYGSPILNCGYLGKDEDGNDYEDECGSRGSLYSTSDEADLFDDCDSHVRALSYDFSCLAYGPAEEAKDADLDDFAVNGFRVINDIVLEEEEDMRDCRFRVEEEEVVTNGNMPYVYQHASNNVKPVMLSESAPNDERVGPDILCNDNRESRARESIKQLVGEACTTSDAQGNFIISRDEYNRVDFSLYYGNAKYFAIKSDSEDDVLKSIKYNMWSCTPFGNKMLNDAYENAQIIVAEVSSCPVLLFFTVNASGKYCGVAEMTGPVDFHRDTDFWLRDKRSGSFPVKWHIIKDLSNSIFLGRIKLKNKENMPVTDSRDIQRMSDIKGWMMLKTFKEHTSKTSLLDVFMSYQHKQQRNLQEEREARLHSVDIPDRYQHKRRNSQEECDGAAQRRIKKTAVGAFLAMEET